MNSDFNKYFKTNKETWDKKVSVHLNSNFYNVADFKKGGSTLNSYEIEELGDVKGKSLLHLQCHFGLDTLSLSRMGAKCTGVDISDEAIKVAIKLNDDLKLDAKFIASNVYDVSKSVTDKFDIVFTSYGVVGWLPDLDLWAQIISEKLSKGGVFYMIEFHPIVWMFDYLKNPPAMRYSYLKKDVIYEEYTGSYTDGGEEIISKEYGWNHGLSEVFTALIKAGLEIEFLHEFEESPYNSFPNMKKTNSGMYVMSEQSNLYPLLYSIKAIKK